MIETFADMFCGIGGFHVAASSLGLRCVFACDTDEPCRRVYEHNFGFCPVGDIAQVKIRDLPDYDLLLAGFPCQPFSIIGSRKGFSDPKGLLFFELVKIIKRKRPQAVVLENVKQLATHNKGRALKKILGTLNDLGYRTDHRILNAINFGLPQRRERVFIVALRGKRGKKFCWPEEERVMLPLSEVLEKKPDTRYNASKHIRDARRARHSTKVKPAIWHENKSKKVSSHPYACALRASASYNYLLVDGKRRLTSREMLRLQGFPDSFEIICSYGQVRKQAGNAVAVPVVAAIIEKMLDG